MTWSAVAFCKPVLVEFDVDACASSSHGMDIPIIVAETVWLSVSIPIRVGSTSVNCVELRGAVSVGQVR